jgi:hypothetical protein
MMFMKSDGDMLSDGLLSVAEEVVVPEEELNVGGMVDPMLTSSAGAERAVQ